MRIPIVFRITLMTVVLAWCAQDAHAVAPAIPQNVICAAGHIFTGKVLSVESHDCKLRSLGGCSPRDAMVVHVRIDRVLTTVPLPTYLETRFSIEAGKTLPMYVFAFRLGANRYPPLLREEEVPVPMTTEWLTDRLVGQSLAFSARSEPMGLPGRPSLLNGSTLPIESVPWVEQALSNHCSPPKLTR
jgi:hypothetical protein